MLIPSDRLDEESEILRRIRQGQRVDHYETIRQCKNGAQIDVSLTISPLRDKDGNDHWRLKDREGYYRTKEDRTGTGACEGGR